MSTMMGLRVLVGLEDNRAVLVAGCIEQEMWAIVDEETSDEWFATMKARYPDVSDWREVIVNVPRDQLKAVFAVTSIDATVDGTT